MISNLCRSEPTEDKDRVSDWAQDAELMPASQMTPHQIGPIIRSTTEDAKQLAHARWGLPSRRFTFEKAVQAKAAKLWA